MIFDNPFPNPIPARNSDPMLSAMPGAMPGGMTVQIPAAAQGAALGAAPGAGPDTSQPSLSRPLAERASVASRLAARRRLAGAASSDCVTVISPHAALPLTPHYKGGLPARLVCRIVSRLTGEMAQMVMERVAVRRDRRRLAAHIRQISMYVCHVALRVPHADIAAAFGRDRSTVGHACHFVEDRRDDKAFDAFVAAIERMVTAVFKPCDIPPDAEALGEGETPASLDTRYASDIKEGDADA